MRGARPENVLLLKEDDDDRVLSRPSGRRCRHEAVECAAAHRIFEARDEMDLRDTDNYLL